MTCKEAERQTKKWDASDRSTVDPKHPCNLYEFPLARGIPAVLKHSCGEAVVDRSLQVPGNVDDDDALFALEQE
jgi:hypothetical protein